MKIVSLLSILSISVILSGCQTIAERRAEQDVEDAASCRSFGAKPGSDAYVLCRTDLQRNREIRRAYSAPVYVTGGFYPYSGFCRSSNYGVRCY